MGVKHGGATTKRPPPASRMNRATSMEVHMCLAIPARVVATNRAVVLPRGGEDAVLTSDHNQSVREKPIPIRLTRWS